MTAVDYPLRFGKDRVLQKGDQLVVYSTADMPDWEIAGNRKTAIFIKDQVWCLTGKASFPKGAIRYILDPWPDYIDCIPGRRIRYDAEYVASRDEALAALKSHVSLSWMLLPFEPLLGFLPSRVKSGIEERTCISARRASFMSLWVELFFFFLAGVVVWVLTYSSMWTMALAPGSGPEASLAMMIILVIFLAADLINRYDSYLREDQIPCGFCEWIFRRQPRASEKAGVASPKSRT